MTRFAAAWRAVGWPGVLALVLVLTALGMRLGVAPALERERDREAQSAQRARASVFELLGQRAQPVAAPPDERFREGFPAPESRGQRVAAVLAAAVRNGVVSRRSDYRVALDPDIGLASYRMTLPAVGSYDALRGFVETALANDPALSLDLLRLRRSQPNTAELQAELQFSLWMNAGGDFVAPRAGGPR